MAFKCGPARTGVRVQFPVNRSKVHSDPGFDPGFTTVSACYAGVHSAGGMQIFHRPIVSTGTISKAMKA